MTDLEMEVFRQANSPVAVRLRICEREAGGRGWSWSDERKGAGSSTNSQWLQEDRHMEAHIYTLQIHYWESLAQK